MHQKYHFSPTKRYYVKMTKTIKINNKNVLYRFALTTKLFGIDGDNWFPASNSIWYRTMNGSLDKKNREFTYENSLSCLTLTKETELRSKSFVGVSLYTSIPISYHYLWSWYIKKWRFSIVVVCCLFMSTFFRIYWKS